MVSHGVQCVIERVERQLAAAFTDVGEAVYDGSPLWKAMRATEVLPELCVFMTKSGEESGQLEIEFDIDRHD